MSGSKSKVETGDNVKLTVTPAEAYDGVLNLRANPEPASIRQQSNPCMKMSTNTLTLIPSTYMNS
jgi:hypothetical protein